MCRIPPYAGDNIPFKLNEHSSVGSPPYAGEVLKIRRIIIYFIGISTNVCRGISRGGERSAGRQQIPPVCRGRSATRPACPADARDTPRFSIPSTTVTNMPSGRTGYPEYASGGKRLLRHGMPRMQEKIAGRGVPQVCGGDAIRGKACTAGRGAPWAGGSPDRAAAARQGGSGLRGQGGCQPTNDRPNSLKKRAPQAGRCPACRRASSRDQQRQGRQGCPTCRGRLHQGFSSSGNAGTPLPGISAMCRIKAARKPAPSISPGKSARTVSKAGKSDTASGNRGYTYGWHPSSGVVFLYQKLFQNRSRCVG